MGSQVPEWQGQMRDATFPRRKKAGEGKGDGGPTQCCTHHTCDCLYCFAQSFALHGCLALNKPAPTRHRNSLFQPMDLGDSYLIEGGTENLPLPTSKAHIRREGQRGLARRTLGVGWSISASADPEWVGKKQEEPSREGRVRVWAEGAVTREEPRATAGALRKGAGTRLQAEREGSGWKEGAVDSSLQGLLEMRPTDAQGHWIALPRRQSSAWPCLKHLLLLGMVCVHAGWKSVGMTRHTDFS